MITYKQILNLAKLLFPTGRAFNIPEGSYIEKLVYGLGKSEQRTILKGLDLLNEILADNANFTEQDATAWETKLNIKIDPIGFDLTQRKLLILRKYKHPGTQIYRQNYRFIEQSLRDAGFDVYIYENRFPDGLGGYTYLDIASISNATYRHGAINARHGFSRMGAKLIDVIANSAYPNENFAVDEPKSCFFISGATLGTAVSITKLQEIEFRKLVLTLKPANTIAVINDISFVEDWILETGFWNDLNHWYDNKYWID